MTPQERDLIQGVFDRLSRTGIGEKDREAEQLILENGRRVPDAAYGLVQAVVALEAGLNHANARINDLQRQLAESRPAGGSFSGAGPWGGGSVPRSGPAPSQPQYAPVYAPQAQPQYAPQAVPAAAPSAAGGFLRNAATMAAGVAGGTLIAEGLSSLFGGHHYGYGGGFAGGSPWGGGSEIVEENVTVNNYNDGGGGGRNDGGGNADSGVQDASYDNSNDSGWDDGGGGFDSGFDDSSDV